MGLHGFIVAMTHNWATRCPDTGAILAVGSDPGGVEHPHPVLKGDLFNQCGVIAMRLHRADQTGQARGIAMVVPALAGLKVAEYAPNQVKKTVVGAGHGDKGQIRMMVKILMPKAVFDSDDAADALAIAICHAHHRGAMSRIPAA